MNGKIPETLEEFDRLLNQPTKIPFELILQARLMSDIQAVMAKRPDITKEAFIEFCKNTWEAIEARLKKEKV